MAGYYLCEFSITDQLRAWNGHGTTRLFLSDTNYRAYSHIYSPAMYWSTCARKPIAVSPARYAARKLRERRDMRASSVYATNPLLWKAEVEHDESEAMQRAQEAQHTGLHDPASHKAQRRRGGADDSD